MAGNSFATRDGTHVTGAVMMGVDGDGFAAPAAPLTADQLCRALAAHAALITGKPRQEAMDYIRDFVNGKTP